MAEPRRGELVLASASPFRRRMLEAAGLSFRVVPAEVDEAAIRQRMTIVRFGARRRNSGAGQGHGGQQSASGRAW